MAARSARLTRARSVATKTPAVNAADTAASASASLMLNIVQELRERFQAHTAMAPIAETMSPITTPSAMRADENFIGGARSGRAHRAAAADF